MADRSGVSRSLRLVVLLFALGTVIVFTRGPFEDRAREALHHPLNTLSALLVAALAVSWLIVMADKAASRAIYRSLAKADYDTAVKRSTAMLRWFPRSAHFTFLRGTALLFAGRLEEAESELRASLTKGSGLAQSARLVNLGYIQMDKGQFQEAIASFQQAAAVFDRSGTAYGAMADARLRGGLEPNLALDLLDRAIKMRTGNPRFVKVDRHTLAYMWADRAWALALQARTEEAQHDIAKALDQVDAEFVPGLAGTKWRVGTAFLKMGRKKEALEHFRRAAEIDPQGTYGKRCAKAAGEVNHSQ
jgi:tetratricopeptide (TPR) repeat protein